MSNIKHKPYTRTDIHNIAKKFKFRGDFFKNNIGAYNAARRLKILDEVCSHMNAKHIQWTNQKLKKLASKFMYRVDFKNAHPSAYATARNRNILLEICDHMVPSRVRPLTEKELLEEALKYNTRKEFENCSPSKYTIAVRLKLIDKICTHMKKSANSSIDENNLYELIKMQFPKTQKFRDRKVKIPNKPHIKGFDIDIYIPELRKGIEFDGDYWHSVEGLKRSRYDWSEEDLQNYSTIKDQYFKQKGIELLHIKEQDWLDNKEACIKKCFEFLGDNYGKSMA